MMDAFSNDCHSEVRKYPQPNDLRFGAQEKIVGLRDTCAADTPSTSLQKECDLGLDKAIRLQCYLAVSLWANFYPALNPKP